MKNGYYFAPGPALLPTEVLEAGAQALLDYEKGISIAELGHRTPAYDRIRQEAASRLLGQMDLSEKEYVVLFLGGGSSLQFAMVPMNFLPRGKIADYVVGGEWGAKALAEANRVGAARAISSSEASQFKELPPVQGWDQGAAYIHITLNNTTEGTEYADLPDTNGVPLVVDATSNIVSRRMSWNRASLIYAGAQKNLGPAGVTVVVLKRAWVEQAARLDVPNALSYRAQLKADGVYNTPPVSAVHLVNETLKWMERQGGIADIEKRNLQKADWVYQAVDRHPGVYVQRTKNPAHRSRMNACFTFTRPEWEKEFLEQAEARGLYALKGYRTIGGVRVSMYNPMPLEGVKALVRFMDEFANARR